MKQIAVAILTLSLNPPVRFGKKIPPALYRVFVGLLLLVLFLAEMLRVYFVMPFPGSQRNETVEMAHWISRNIGWMRIVVLGISAIALLRIFRHGKTWEKIVLPLALAGYVPVFILFNYRYDADRIFLQPANKSFIPAAESVDKSKLVIGISVNGEARAYPIQLIGYHHQVVDTVGNEPVMITYCTVCRTGRVYSTLINSRHESFRLVGMDHFNAVFEDVSTHSWWQQANGKAIAGPLKGLSLKEIPSIQVTIDSWLRQYPNSMVMAPDPVFDERYFRLEDYDRGTMQSPLVKRAPGRWQPKSWVVGVKNESTAMAYDWNELVTKRVIQDSLEKLPILVAMEADNTSFHVYDRRIDGAVLQFNTTLSGECFTDSNTLSTWNMDGVCVDGPLKGSRLLRVQAYNEFWHSWEMFQTNAKKYSGK